MRIILSRLLRYKTFQKLTVSYFLLVLITVSLLSSVLFSLFSRSAVAEIDRNSKTILSQISYASDVIYNQVMTIGNSLINDPQVVSFLNDKEEDKTKNYHVFQQMSQIKNAYPFIYSIGVYRPSTETNVDTSGIPFDKSLYAISAQKYMEFYPRKLSVKGINNSSPLQLLTFMLYPDYSLHFTANPLIYINVEEQSILTTIRSISKSDALNNVFVMDSEGSVLSHTDSGLFMEDVSGEDYVRRILSEGLPEHSFTANIFKEKHLVTYVKSAEMNWYFVSVSPYDKLISNIRELRNVTLLVTSALGLAGLLISVFLTKNIYKPMSSLFDTINPALSTAGSPLIDEYKVLTEVFTTLEEKEKSMQFVIRRSSQTIREHYLLALLKGNIRDIAAPEESIRQIDEDMPGPYFCAIVLKIDEIEAVKERVQADQQSLLRFALGNIAKETLEPFGACDVLVTEENEVVAVSQYETNELPLELKKALEGAQNFLKRYFRLTVSAGIGDIVFGRKNIQYSYTSAQQYVKYRLIYGKESILDAHLTRSHFLAVLSYPTASEKKLIDAVQSGKPGAIRERIEEFVGLVAPGSSNQVITYSIQLLLSVLKHFEYLQSLPDTNFNAYLDAIADIEAAESLEDIVGIIAGYCAKIGVLLEEKNQWLNAQKHNSIIENVQNYIREHYTEPGLSLESVSNIAGLSPSYLGKLFKASTQQSFSEALNHTRLEKARELLITSNETAAKISESVGMYNITYFSTLFKKKYGVSPSVYREQASMKRLDSRE
ncbi:helix-turn-helix domain-containing protein [Paenibacillus typhae]|uniref:Helix-turn-helix domain-containing protein n=1 Tax=Paenibacillus typhae TaxID=1174501 RepID=A0A1G9AZ04_9BACL|nr:helix-turn-helix domain-containing protein [Paenibacillus typhae]SDK32492.1 Helix-turn-helix domain-containing protein [Paenibacillus typhae]